MNKTSQKAHLNSAVSDLTDWGTSHEWSWKGFKCHWRVIGEDHHQPLVLVHGFGASSSHWRHNARPLAAAGFCVYGIDLIGFGKSEQPSFKKIGLLNNYLWSKQLSAFIQNIVQTKHFSKVILVGNSLGSLTALTTAAFWPEQIAALVAAPLPDPAFMQPLQLTKSRSLKKIQRKLLTIFFKFLPLELLVPLISRTILIKFALQGAYYQSIKSDQQLIRLITQPARRRTAARALRSMCLGMSMRPKGTTAPELFERIEKNNKQLPILLIWGDHDKLVPQSIGQKLLKKHSWINLKLLGKTGHCPHDESPDDFNQCVLTWLNSNLMNNTQRT